MGRQDATAAARLQAVVHGRVQGVNFRDFTRFWARELMLSGTVRNLPDGRSVEVVAEGPRASLDDLLVRLREGPRFARVEAIDVTWTEPKGDHGGFYVIA